MKRTLMLLLTVTGFQFAHAQLGESEEKCTALFGKPVRTAGTDVPGVKLSAYRTTAFQITVAFKQDVASYFVYRKNDGGNLSDPEIQSILDGHPAGKRGWSKKVITGERRPVVGRVSKLKSPFHDQQHGPREWHVLGHDEFCAAYYIEKNVLLIWNAQAGFDAATILKQNRL